MLLVVKNNDKELELAEKIHKSSKNVVFFTFNQNGKNIKMDGIGEVKGLNILFDIADTEAFVKGDKSGKKLLANLKKTIVKTPKTKDYDAVQRRISIRSFIKIVNDFNVDKKGTIVLIMPTLDDKKLAKLYDKAVEILFKSFGLPVTYAGDKKARKQFKGKKKAVKKALKRLTSECVVSEKGESKLSKIEEDHKLIITGGFIHEIIVAGKKFKSKHIAQFFAAVRNALKAKKSGKKIEKLYKEIQKISEDIPSVKKLKDLAKKKKKAVYILMIIEHLAARLSGYEFGSKEYFEYMRPVIEEFGIEMAQFKKEVNVSLGKIAKDTKEAK